MERSVINVSVGVEAQSDHLQRALGTKHRASEFWSAAEALGLVIFATAI